MAMLSGLALLLCFILLPVIAALLFCAGVVAYGRAVLITINVGAAILNNLTGGSPGGHEILWVQNFGRPNQSPPRTMSANLPAPPNH